MNPLENVTELKDNRKNEDLNFLYNPMKWPAWPLCPIKRYINGAVQCGFIMDVTLSPIVYLENMFTYCLDMELKKIQDNENIKQIKYDSFIVMLNDGWMVD